MFDRLFRSDFAKNLATLVSATVAAQVISFLFNMLLARLYTPEQFGILSVFVSLAGLVAVFSCFKFDVALVAAKSDEDAEKLLALGFRINFIVSSGALVLVAANYLLGANGMYAGEKVYDWLWFIPPAVFLITASQLLWMWNVRGKKFKNISWVRIGEALVNGGLAAAVFGIGAWGLLAGTLASQALAVLLLLFIVLRAGNVRMGGFSKAQLAETFRNYKEFPRVNILQGFLDIFQLSLIVIFTQHYYGDAVAGLYGQCMRVLQVPMRLIVLPVAHVYFAEASERFRTGGDLYSLTKKTTLRTALFALPVTAALLAAGPELFALVFGEKWREAGVYAQLLSVWILVDLARAPVQQVASVVGKQKWILLVSVGGSVLLTGFLFAGYLADLSARWIFAGIGASQALVALVLVFLSLRLSKLKA